MVSQLLKLHLVDKLGKSEFGKKKKQTPKTGLELSARIRKQNTVPIFLGFKILLLALGGLKGRNPILVIPVLPIENTWYRALSIVDPPKMFKKIELVGV